MNALEQGYLVIADISGYTSFMAETELAHSQEIMSNLLTLVLDAFTPTLELVEVEGDAVFVYAPEHKLGRGETLLEMIESTYVAFRDHLLTMKRSTTCRCRACQEIPRLDLKFFTHFGEYAMQQVAGRRKVVGTPVNLIHRLLKNGVTERTGWSAYAMFTDSALERMGVEPVDMHPAVESYEHLGDITTASFDLKKRYVELTDQRQIVVSDEEAHVIIDIDYPVPPQILWVWLHDPGKRMLWMEGVTWSAGERPGGRQGPGAVNHCAHSGGELRERILDWRPFHYYTCEGRSGKLAYWMTGRITPTADGSRAHITCKLQLPLPQWISRPLGRFFFLKLSRFDQTVQRLRSVLANQPDRKEETDAAIAATPA
jgi:hypothetical protein